MNETVGTCLDYNQENQIITYLQQLYYAYTVFPAHGLCQKAG